MWNNLESLRSLGYWLNWASVLAVLLGSVGLVGARLVVERRVTALARQMDLERTEREARLQRDLDESRGRVALLEDRQRPRTIPGDLAQNLVRALSAATKFPILIGAVNEREPVMLAGQFAQLFKAAGWTVSMTQFIDVHGTGVGLLVAEGQVPPAISALARAIADAGYQVPIEAAASNLLQGNAAVLFIGSKQ